MSLPSRGLAPDLVAKAQAVANAIEPVRFETVTMLIQTSRMQWRGDETEIIAAAYESVGEYWRTAMSEPMTAVKFIRLLACHQCDPRGIDYNNLLKLEIVGAMKLASKQRAEWFLPATITPGTETVITDELMLYPRPASEWLLSLPKRRHLVPSGLRDFIEGKGQESQAENDSGLIYSSGAPGRPTSMHLIELEMRRRAECDELQPTLKVESESLSKWLGKEHPRAHPTQSKTIRNVLRNLYKELTSPK